MRTLTADKIEYLSLRLDEVPGLNPAMKEFINTKLLDKSIGIKRDRKIFIMTLPKHGNPTTKVKLQTPLS